MPHRTLGPSAHASKCSYSFTKNSLDFPRNFLTRLKDLSCYDSLAQGIFHARFGESPKFSNHKISRWFDEDWFWWATTFLFDLSIIADFRFSCFWRRMLGRYVDLMEVWIRSYWYLFQLNSDIVRDQLCWVCSFEYPLLSSKNAVSAVIISLVALHSNRPAITFVDPVTLSLPRNGKKFVTLRRGHSATLQLVSASINPNC